MRRFSLSMTYKMAALAAAAAVIWAHPMTARADEAAPASQVVTLAAECVEEIAQIVPIYTEEAEETPRTQE